MASDDEAGTTLSSLAERLALDRGAAKTATTLAVVTVAILLVGQAAVAAAVTGGAQPLESVESVPSEPSSTAWDEAETRTVSLSEQQMAPPIGGGSVDELDVQTVANESHVAVRMSWDDPTRNADIAEPNNFSDAAAVMLKTGNQPPITMGAAGEPVNIWYWRASWRHGPEQSEGVGDMYAYPHDDSVTRPGQQAGNPLSGPAESGAQNYYAKGFGSLSHASAQPVDASGERTEDGWQVTFVRNRTGAGQYDASITDEQVYVAFAVWNGSADEVNGQKSLTLQYSTLDPASGNLSIPDDSGGAGDGGSLQAGGDESGGGADDRTLALPGFVGGIVLSAVLVWFVAYWRMS